MGSDIAGSGGLEKYVRELASYCITNTDLRVKIVSRMGKVVSLDSKINSKIRLRRHRFPFFYLMLSHLPNPLTIILGTLALIKDIGNEHNIRKIMHAHDVGSSLLTVFIINKIFNIPFIVQIHGFPIKEQKIKLLKANSLLSNFIWFLTKTWHAITMKLIKHSAMLVLVNNKEVKSFYESCGIPSKKLEIISSAVDLQEFKRLLSKQTRKCLELLNLKNTVTIGYVGGLKPQKNVETLMEAFREFMKSYPEAKASLIIIGDGPMKPFLEEYAKKYTISNYTFFMGYIPNAYRFLNTIDIFVLPSLSEGSPFSLIEAMACGRAIIASDIPAIREIVENGKEALLFDPRNPQQLKNLISTLYSNPKLREELGENARRKAKQYDINTVFPKILQIYKRFLEFSANSN